MELQVHEDVVIREKAENLIEASLKCGKVSKRGRWELKNKKCMNNYEKYSRIVAQQAENNTDNVFKKTAHNSRYK